MVCVVPLTEILVALASSIHSCSECFILYRTYTVIVFSEVEHKSRFAKVRIDYIHGQVYTRESI
jgi:hypothetical protein